MTGNPLITCTFCRTEYERCQPRRQGAGRRVTACKVLAGDWNNTAEALCRREQE